MTIKPCTCHVCLRFQICAHIATVVRHGPESSVRLLLTRGGVLTRYTSHPIATFDVAALADSVVISDDDVQAYYDARPTDFMSPESVDFEFLDIQLEQLAADLEVSEEDLQQHYQASVSRFQQDEQRQAAHILIPFEGDEVAAEELATSLTARAKAGEPFADLAQTYSKDGGTAEQGGDLGIVFQTQMPGALGDAIFTMSKGDILGPVRTDFGFHVVVLNDVISGGPLPIDQVRAELEQELRELEADDSFRAIQRQIADALFDATDMQALADASGLEVQATTGYTRAGGAPFGANQLMLDTIFDGRILNDGQISDVIEIDAGRSVVVKVSAYHEEARKTVDEVRDDIVFAQQTERALLMVEDRARRLREGLAEGKDFGSLAFEMEAAFSPAVTVGRQDQEIDRALLSAIFLAKKPSIGNARLGSTVTNNGDYAVFTVDAVIPGRPESIPLADRDARKEELENAAGQADFSAFVSELERRGDISISDDALAEPDFLQ